jgi:copper chaperone
LYYLQTDCRKKLRGEEAVKKVDIDYMTDSVIVEFDLLLITKEEIKID